MILDAQGGGLGRQLISQIRKEVTGTYLIAVGTNSAATSAMLKAGADEAATGENAARVVSNKADIIIGPIGIVIADALLGEVTPAMAVAVGQADAPRILIPLNRCENLVAGVADLSMGALIEDAMRKFDSLAGGTK